MVSGANFFSGENKFRNRVPTRSLESADKSWAGLKNISGSLEFLDDFLKVCFAHAFFEACSFDFFNRYGFSYFIFELFENFF